MLAQDPATVPMISEKELRRQIDRAISRALVDPEYTSVLLADPTAALEDYGCPPQQYLSLRSIDAANLVDFARQAQTLFWISESRPGYPHRAVRARNEEERRPLSAAAAY
jgi:hypothetical protein